MAIALIEAKYLLGLGLAGFKRKTRTTGFRCTKHQNGVLEVGRADYPAEGVIWSEARDYCVAQGKHFLRKHNGKKQQEEGAS